MIFSQSGGPQRQSGVRLDLPHITRATKAPLSKGSRALIQTLTPHPVNPPSTRNMPSLGLLLVSLLLWGSTTANSDKVFGCGGPGKDEDVDCQQPLKPVTTVVPGSFYVAKIPCPDCPMIKTERTPGSMKQFVAHEENDLVRLHTSVVVVAD